MIIVNASFARVPARAATARLGKIDWAVLHAICLHADKDGRAFPSMARIAQIAGIKRNHVPRSAARLEKRGLLRRNRMPRPNGGWQVTHYEILFEPLGDVTAQEDTPANHVTTRGDTPAEMSPPQVTGCHRRGCQGVTSGGALTDYLTNQGTEEAYQEEAQKEGVGLDGGGVTNRGDIEPDAVEAVALDPSRTCRWYVTNDLGFKICGKPALMGDERCPEHAQPRTPDHPIPGKSNGRAAP
jgi:hypothetical protein